MQRHCFQPPRLATVGVFIAAIGLQACGSDITGIQNPPGSGFSLTVGPSTIPLTPGATVFSFIQAKRLGGFRSDIVLSVTGAPEGLDVTVVTTAVADSFAVVFEASTTLAAARYPIVVNVTAAGAPAQRETFTAEVSAPPVAEAVNSSPRIGTHQLP